MSLRELLDRVERSHAVQTVLHNLSLESLDHAEHVASRFEDAATHIATLLPDGPQLVSLLLDIKAIQGRVVDAIHAAARAAAEPATDAPPASMPGRDHPITWTDPTPSAPQSADEQAPATDVPADQDETPSAPQEPSGDPADETVTTDSGPAGGHLPEQE